MCTTHLHKSKSHVYTYEELPTISIKETPLNNIGKEDYFVCLLINI